MRRPAQEFAAALRRSLRALLVAHRLPNDRLLMVTTLCVDAGTYRYRTGWMLGPIDAEYTAGITAIVGPNGAGKSTLLNLLGGTLRWRSGSMLRDGATVSTRGSFDRHKHTLGFLPQHPTWPSSWRVDEALAFSLAAFSVPRRDRDAASQRALVLAGATDYATRRFGELSGGQRQRSFLALALAHDPGLVILDEPTVGLDPAERIRLRGVIADLASERTVLLSTHLLDDVALTADTVHVVVGGKIRWKGAVQQLEELGRTRTPGGQDSFEHTSPAERGYLYLLQEATP